MDTLKLDGAKTNLLNEGSLDQMTELIVVKACLLRWTELRRGRTLRDVPSLGSLEVGGTVIWKKGNAVIVGT